MAEGARITIDAQLQFRHDVEANWLAADPILKVGEPAYTIGYSDRFKLGDGQSKWSELPYLQLGEGGGGGGSQAYESLAWSAIKTLTSGDASVLAQAYAVKQAYTELKSLIPNLADYYTKEQVNALIPSLEGYAKESWVLGKGYATESFVNTKIADLINGAPSTLDTLKEIADAFAQSQDVIEALDEAIGKKASQSALTALAARVAANEGNITSLSSNKLDKSIWDSVFEIDAKGNLRAKVGIYSTSFISARTSDPSAGGGSGGGAFSLYTWDQVKAMTAEVGGVAPTAYALKQAYNELINATPTLSWNNIQDKPIFATVATSGSYSDLIGRPTALSDLANDVGYITAAALGGLASESWVSNNFLGLGGGTMTGIITLKGEQYTGNYALNASNSDIINVNAIYTSDVADSAIEGYQFKRSNGNYDSIWASDGVFYFSPDGNNADRTSVYSTNYTVIHSGNYSSYALPISGGTLTGRLSIQYASDTPLYLKSTTSGNGAYVGFKASDDSILGYLGITADKIARFSLGGGTYYDIIHSGNIDSYNAGSATKLATPRTIWGQSFDGTGNVDSILTVNYSNTSRATGVEVVSTNGGEASIGFKLNDTNRAVVGVWGTALHLWTQTKGNAISIPIATGNVLIGTTTDNGAKLQVNGNITASGTIYSAVGLYTPGYLSARSTAGSSDRALKTNIAPIKNALAYVLGTNYVSFDWKDTGEHSVGIIAQEELNREWSCLVQKYGKHYSYQYTQHTALLGSALQEEDRKVEALKVEVVTLKAEVTALKTEVQRLRNERQLWQQ